MQIKRLKTKSITLRRLLNVNCADWKKYSVRDMRTMRCFAMGINRQNYTTVANRIIQQFRILNSLFPEVEISFVVEE